jgi:hypothetical protein
MLLLPPSRVDEEQQAQSDTVQVKAGLEVHAVQQVYMCLGSNQAVVPQHQAMDAWLMMCQGEMVSF